MLPLIACFQYLFLCSSYLSDDHQRVILKVKVRLPSAFVYRSADSAQSADVGDTVTVDVMTSHFR